MNGTPWRDAPRAEYAVLGDPIGHSLSPAMHNAAYASLELPLRYEALQVPAGELALALDHLAALGYRGVNVTLPLKEEALGWAESASPMAVRVGAANTLHLARRHAENTDAPGFMEALAGLASFAEGTRKALVLGAGGSARAVVAALDDAGWDVRVWARRHERAVELAAALGGRAVQVPDPEGAHLLVNTTSAGLAGEAPTVLWDRAQPGTHLMDLAYGGAARPFLEAAQSRGLAGCDGTAMLVAQGALALESWLGTRAPREVMLLAIL